VAAIGQEIARQAQMIAFNDLFWFIGWITFALLPLLLIMKRPEKAGLVIA
jgi:DHA2 family multidrug resistance protein